MTSLTYAFDYPEKGDASAGAKAWAENCTRCHNMRSPSDLRDDQWVTTAFHMRVRGGLTGQETRDILTFLQSSNAKIATSTSTKVFTVTALPTKSADTSGKAIYESTCVVVRYRYVHCFGIYQGYFFRLASYQLRNNRRLRNVN